MRRHFLSLVAFSLTKHRSEIIPQTLYKGKICKKVIFQQLYHNVKSTYMIHEPKPVDALNRVTFKSRSSYRASPKAVAYFT